MRKISVALLRRAHKFISKFVSGTKLAFTICQHKTGERQRTRDKKNPRKARFNVRKLRSALIVLGSGRLNRVYEKKKTQKIKTKQKSKSEEIRLLCTETKAICFFVYFVKNCFLYFLILFCPVFHFSAKKTTIRYPYIKISWKKSAL